VKTTRSRKAFITDGAAIMQFPRPVDERPGRGSDDVRGFSF
jgi:hypothetical protein